MLAMVFGSANKTMAQNKKIDLDDKLFYILPGYSFSGTLLLRVGLTKNEFGGELLVKHELPPTKKMTVDDIEGKTSHRGFMVGITWQPITSLFVTGNVGYGVSGTYHVTQGSSNNPYAEILDPSYNANNDPIKYEIIDSKKGIEVGGHLTYILPIWGHVKVGFYGGASVLPLLGDDHPFVDISIGVGYVYLFGGDSYKRNW